MSVSKLMKSTSLFVVNQHGSCNLSITIKLAGRSRPGGRSEHSDSWPYNTDSFVSIDSAVEDCYNLSHTELHCLGARERMRERTDRDGQRRIETRTEIRTDRDMNEQRRTERRTDRDMNERTYITGTLKNSLLLNCETIQCLTVRGSGGG